MQQTLKERDLTRDILAKHLNSIFSYHDSDESTKQLLIDAFIKKIEIRENDDIIIYCNGVDQDFAIKNEHLDKVFTQFSFGGARETRTPTISHQILSLARLPIPP